MTHRHVTAEFARNSGGMWPFTPGITGRVDCDEELSAAQPGAFALPQILGVHDAVDVALLRCASDGSGEAGGQLPLPIAGNPGIGSGTKVHVVGYPAAASRRNAPEEMQRIFAGIYNVERLRPGAVVSLTNNIVHDCSNLVLRVRWTVVRCSRPLCFPLRERPPAGSLTGGWVPRSAPVRRFSFSAG